MQEKGKTNPGNYSISTDKNKLSLAVIHGYLSQSYWCKGVPVETVKHSIENSLCFGVYDEMSQVGFARVVTDYATFAYLADVFILEEYRGFGLSKLLMNEIINHPGLQGLRRWVLATRDAHGLYARYGFKPLAAPDRFMELHDPDVYKS